MARVVEQPTVIAAAGEPPKRIEEFIGRAGSPAERGVSIARMVSPPGWSEPGQTPEFTEYLAVCLPAFSPDTVHREDG